MKKDKYPLGGGLMPSDASRPGSAGLGGRAMSSSMNGSAYMSSMYGSNGSPYSGMPGQGPMSPDDGSQEGGVAHPSHSPGSVKSEAGGGASNPGPPTSHSSGSVSMSSGP